MIRLVLHPNYKMDKDYVFSSIIHPSQNAYWHYKNFYNTFMLGQNVYDLDKAIGVWGSVRLDTCTYGETVYSAVKFVYEPLAVRLKALEIGAEEKEKG